MDYKVFLDLDGVIADFDGAVIKHLDLDITHEQISDWWALNRAFSRKMMRETTHEDLWGMLPVDLFANLRFTKEAKMILTLVDPYKPCIITMPPGVAFRAGDAGYKEKWIAMNMHHYYKEGRYLIGMAKHLVAGPGKLLIDDSDRNCAAWREEGGAAILFPRPWNEHRHIDDPIPFLQMELIRILKENY